MSRGNFCKCGGGVGVFLAIGALVAALFVHLWLHGYITDQVKAAQSVTGVDSPGYKAFRNASELVDLMEDYYIFNITNPEEVEAGGAVKAEQIGPFRMKLNKYKPEVNTSWETDGTVTFLSQTEYTYIGEPEAWLVNVTTWRLGLFVAMKQFTSDKFPDDIVIDIFNKCIDSHNVTTPFIQITVQEALLGYTDPMLSCVRKDTFNVVPDWVALINQPVNASSTTGLNGIYSGGDYSATVEAPPANAENENFMYLGMTELPYWNSTYANMINGTSGTSMQPNQAKVGHTAYFWVDLFFRSANFIARSDEEYKGVALVRYGIDLTDFETGEVNPNNKPFYITTRGIQPSPPANPSPVLFGQPYFLNADTDNITAEFVGPMAKAYALDDTPLTTYLDFEPNTGALFRVHKRLQASLMLTPNTLFPITDKWPTSIVPLFWADEHMELSDSLVDKVKDEVLLGLKIAKYGPIALAGLGALLLLLSVLCCCAGRRRAQDDEEAKSSAYNSVDATRRGHDDDRDV